MTPRLSHVIQGTIFKANGTTALPYANVMLVNQTSGEVITTTANVDGKYILDCNNFTTYNKSKN